MPIIKSVWVATKIDVALSCNKQLTKRSHIIVTALCCLSDLQVHRARSDDYSSDHKTGQFTNFSFRSPNV